eukprot:5533550-Prymnesium_polylepis.2
MPFFWQLRLRARACAEATPVACCGMACCEADTARAARFGRGFEESGGWEGERILRFFRLGHGAAKAARWHTLDTPQSALYGRRLAQAYWTPRGLRGQVRGGSWAP